MNIDKENLYWCAGLFDAEGSFTFAPKSPEINIVNTNPIAVTKFYETMSKHGIEFDISERSKPSKSSKKKRWDLYIRKKEDIQKFISIMETYIHGKQRQLQLIKNFYNQKINGKYASIINEFNELMKYYNQTSYILIINENILREKVGDIIDLQHHNLYDSSLKNDQIVTNEFSSINYLSGIIDGEGTFYINQRNTRQGKIIRYTPIISFVNTNSQIISYACSVLKNNNIGFHVQSRISPIRNRIRWDISISGTKRTFELSNILNGKLVIKNRQSDLMNKYSSLRLNNCMQKNDIGQIFKESIEALNKEN